MNDILFIKGNVSFTITLDPSVWIFDDRRIDLNTFFDNDDTSIDSLEDYKKSIGKHWDREIMEGAVHPPTLKAEKVYEKERILTGTFGMALTPFLQNAEPKESATTLTIECEHESIDIQLDEAENLLLCFSQNGKPLKEDGPVHVFFKDGRNRQNPIKRVRAFIIE